MDKVRLAVLGVGSWTAVNHLPAIEARGDVEWVAAVDTDPERRRNVAARFPFGLVTESVDEALATGVDAVIVGSTPNAHHALVRAALESGANVLCEKPFTTSGREAWELVRLAESGGQHLLTAFGWNYTPMVRRAEALLAANPIGTIEHIQVHMATALREMYLKVMPVWGRPEEFLPIPSSYTSLERGAGYNQAQLSHAYGLALWLTRLRARRIFAFMSTLGSEVDLHDAVSIEFTNGATGSISGTTCPLGSNDNKHQLDIRIFGSEGQLLLDFDREMIWLYKDAATDFRLVLPDGAGAYECTGPANALLDLTLGHDVENRSPGWLAAQATEMTAAGYDSWRSGRAEDIDTSL
jgi:predicted dehydrogenase